MAVVKYSSIIEELRGKLNGTVFSKYLDGFSGYKKGQPSPWGSARQQNIRQNFQVMANRWGELTPQVREAWNFIAANTLVKNRLGESVHISGYAYYQKFNLAQQALNQGVYTTPNTSLNPPYYTQVLSAALAATQTGNLFEITQLQLTQEILFTSQELNSFSILISLPFERKDQNYDKTFYLAGYGQRPQGDNPGDTFTTSIFNQAMPGAWYTFEDAWHEIKIIYRTSESAQEQEPVFFKVQATFTPPVTVYEPELENAIPLMDVVPSPQQLENLNNYILALKDAANLPHGAFNLNQVFDVVYNFAVNSFHNARIDYVTSTLRGQEIANPGFSIDFQAFRGISRGFGGAVAFDTDWNVTAPGQNANTEDNHQTIAITTSDTASMTGRIAGSQLENFEFIPLQNVGGNPMFRFRTGGLALSNFANPNTRGAFAIARTSTTAINFSRNSGPLLTGVNNLQGYTNETFLILATKASGQPEAPRVGLQVAHFTAGKSDVDTIAVNNAIRNYLSNYGFELYL